MQYIHVSLEGGASYLSIARSCALSLPAAYQKSGEVAMHQKTRNINQPGHRKPVRWWKACWRWKSILTASASAGSYQMWIYGWLRASSTEMRHSGSMTSILDSRSRAWLAVMATEKRESYYGKAPRALLHFSSRHQKWLPPPFNVWQHPWECQGLFSGLSLTDLEF